MHPTKYSILVILFIQQFFRDAVDGQCQIKFEKYENTNARGGIEQFPLTEYNTVLTCRQKCIRTQTCVAVDFNRQTLQCFIFLNPDGTPPQQGINNAVDHYVLKNDCQKCSNSFEEKIGTYSRNGDVQSPTVNTSELCIEVCRQRVDCLSVDFNIANKACFVHTTNEPELSNGNVNKYYKRYCGECYQGYTKYEKSASGKGNLQLSIVNTLQLCRDKCEQYVSCVAFEFNRATSLCYTFSANQTVIYNNDVDHYVKTNCYYNTNPDRPGTPGNPGTPGYPDGPTTAIMVQPTSECDNTFTERPNSNAPGGTPQPITVNTVDACKITCQNDPQCAAFDFATSRCWFHATVPATPGFSTGTTQYVKNKCGDCIEGFTEYTKARIMGPSKPESPLVDTFAECRAACLRLDTCFAFDLVRTAVGSATSTCYISIAKLEFVRSSYNELSTHYRRTDCGQPLTTPTLKPGPVAVCIAGFTSVTSARGMGNAVPQTDYRTISACRERCRSIFTCTGFNYHVITRQCSTFTNADLEFTDDNDYIFERNTGCIEIVTPIGGTTLQPFQCIPVFAERPNTYAIGGNAIPSATSIMSCTGVCRNDNQCVAVDFTTSGGCFVHRNFPNSRAADNNVNQYIKTPCLGCDDGFSVFEGIRSIGGRDENFNTLESCHMRCLQFSSCVGFDFNKVTASCTRYSGSVGTLYYDENTVHYRKSSCSGCLDTFDKISNTNMFSGIIQENIKSELACRAFCLSRTYAECRAYDWDRVRSECFIHDRVDTTNSNSDVDLFTRQQCYQTTTLDPAVTGKPISCPLTHFKLIPGKMSPNGIPQSQDKNTVDKCMNICEDLESCVGMDFSTALKKCWIFTRPILEVVNSNGVDHYVKQPCRPCENGYTLHRDEKGRGLDKQPGTFDYVRCRTVCEGQPTCSGFDYSRVDKECYLSFIRVESMTSSPAVGFDHYRKTNCQACVDTFEELSGIVSIVDVTAVDVTNSLQCQEVCRRLPECIASDYRSQDSRCFIHTDMNDLLDQNLIINPRITHYRRVPCNLDLFATTTQTGCIKQFAQERDTYYRSGGRFQKAAASTSRSACQRICRFDGDCAAYEWDHKKYICWLHYSSDDLTSSTRVSDNDIDHYRKAKGCADTTEPQAVVGDHSSCFEPSMILLTVLVCSSLYAMHFLRT